MKHVKLHACGDVVCTCSYNLRPKVFNLDKNPGVVNMKVKTHRVILLIYLSLCTYTHHPHSLTFTFSFSLSLSPSPVKHTHLLFQLTVSNDMTSFKLSFQSLVLSAFRYHSDHLKMVKQSNYIYNLSTPYGGGLCLCV